MQVSLQFISAFTSLFLLCGIVVHDTHIDKVAMHVMRVAESESKSVGGSTPHTHIERASLKQLSREAAAYKHGVNIRYRNRKNLRRGFMNDGGVGYHRELVSG